MKTLLMFCLFIVVALAIRADQTALTSGGRKVILKDNGTWQYAEAQRASTTNYDFRKTRWGMIKSDVIKSESSSPMQEADNALAFKGTINSLDCIYFFSFSQGQLVRCNYLITEEHTNKNDYISDFDSLKSALTIKYGEPTDDKTIWKNSLYRDDKEEWGLAVSIGHLCYYTSWKTDTTEISLGLIGDNFEINFFIDYSSIALAELEKQQRQESSQSDL